MRFAKRLKQLTASGLILILMLVSLVLVLSIVEFSSQLAKLRVASSDSQVWTVSRLEVDHKNLLVALFLAQNRTTASTPEARKVVDQDIRKAFDIFYSRVSVVTTLLNKEALPQQLRQTIAGLVVNLQIKADDIDRTEQIDGKREGVAVQAL